MAEAEPPHPVRRNIRAIAELEEKSKAIRGPLEPISERVSDFEAQAMEVVTNVAAPAEALDEEAQRH